MRRLVLLAAAALAAGCSGGGDDAPTREQWAARANEACRVYERRIAALGTPATPADARSFIRRALPVAREEVRKLRALEEPPADAARIELMLDTVEEGIEALAGVVDDETDAAAATARGRAAARRADALARQLGATDCASG